MTSPAMQLSGLAIRLVVIPGVGIRPGITAVMVGVDGMILGITAADGIGMIRGTMAVIGIGAILGTMAILPGIIHIMAIMATMAIMVGDILLTLSLIIMVAEAVATTMDIRATQVPLI